MMRNTVMPVFGTAADVFARTGGRPRRDTWGCYRFGIGLVATVTNTCTTLVSHTQGHTARVLVGMIVGVPIAAYTAGPRDRTYMYWFLGFLVLLLLLMLFLLLFLLLLL
ncbi:hypothetical protein EGW08_005358 [Elysia chlorotica]|uniref:Uncharacterized protein n=1 Tax=Elysia chlorotica TaxID=188477 RepID=A0A3S1HVF8_ELYCH|nr:hypothetical protein EGW08_005358 [Elysia chlorotica]